MSFMGALMAGGVAAGIYTTNGPESCKYVTAHSGAPVVVLEDETQLAKYAKLTQQDFPQLRVRGLQKERREEGKGVSD